MAKISCFFDGCCEPVNPGGTASYGAVIFIAGKRVWECSELFIPVVGRPSDNMTPLAKDNCWWRKMRPRLKAVGLE